MPRRPALPSLPAPADRQRQAARRAGPLAGAAWAAAAALTLLLGGCASGPPDGPPLAGERGGGPGGPGELSGVPDAVPRVEPIRPGGANKPYEVMGKSYSPETRDVPMRQEGLASWYGRRFHGRRTASGELFDMYAMTAAHKTMPLPSYARIRNPANGREVVVRVNDRGPFHSERIVDLSYAAAVRLGIQDGVAKVQLERLTHEDIRSGAWRRGAPADDGAVAAGPAAALPPGAVRPTAARDANANAAAATAPARDASAASERNPVPAPTPAPGPAFNAATGTESRGGSSATAAASPEAGDRVAAAAIGETPGSPLSAPTPRDGPAAPPAAPIADGSPMRASTEAARGFWVQLGAFRDRAGALDFHRRVAAELAWLAPLMAVNGEASPYRLQAGPYASRDEAQDAAQRVRDALRLVPVIVERR